MYNIRYSRFYPNVNHPLVYALNHQKNPIFIDRKLEDGVMTLGYRLPPEIHWSLRTIKSRVPEDLLLNIGKYMYSFNVYRLEPKRTRMAYPRIKVII